MQTREWQQGYYLRDVWQVTRRFTLTVGARFEHFPVLNRGEFGIERYDPTTNKVLVGGRGSVPRDAGTWWRTSAAGSYTMRDPGDPICDRMQISVSSQPSGKVPLRPSERLKPPTWRSTSSRKDMLAPMTLRTSEATRGMPRWLHPTIQSSSSVK